MIVILQLFAPLFQIHKMEEWISKVTNLEIERAIHAEPAMSLLVNLQELVRIMANGLEMHQLVKVNTCSFCKWSL